MAARSGERYWIASETLDDSLSQLRINYSAVAHDHPYPPAERMIDTYRARGALARAFGYSPILYADPPAPGGDDVLQPSREVVDPPVVRAPAPAAEPVGTPASTPVPPDVTAESVDNARAAIRAARPLRKRAVALLRTSGGKQLLCQFPKSLTSLAKSASFSAIVEDYPILGPIIDVFVGAFDKSVETRVERATDRVVDALIKDPANSEQIISEAAREIATSTPVDPPPNLWNRIRSEANGVRLRIGEIVRVNRRVSSLRMGESPKPSPFPPEPSPNASGPGSAEEIVDCYCGARFVGKRPRYLCSGRCRL